MLDGRLPITVMVPGFRVTGAMDEATFDEAARIELHSLEDAFADIDPDDVEVTTSDGVLRLELRDGRASSSTATARRARSGWPRSRRPGTSTRSTAAGARKKTGEELRPTLAKLVHERIGVAVPL